jgi:hypothetical protein
MTNEVFDPTLGNASPILNEFNLTLLFHHCLILAEIFVKDFSICKIFIQYGFNS